MTASARLLADRQRVEHKGIVIDEPAMVMFRVSEMVGPIQKKPARRFYWQQRKAVAAS